MKRRNLLVKIVTIVLFSLLILSFAIWGIGDIFRGGGHSQMIAEIGSTKIEQRDFAAELTSEMNSMSQRLGVQLTIDQARAFGIPQQVLQRMVTRALLDEMSKRLGMVITEEQMKGFLRDNKDFKNAAGQFDTNRFNQILIANRMSEQTFLTKVGEDMKRQQLVSAVTDGAEAPESLAKRLFSYREERRTADYVTIANDSFTDLGKPDEAALQKVYDDAGSELMTPAYKKITLVVLSVAEAAKGVTISDDRIAKAFQERKDSLSTPERRTVSQAVLPDKAAAQALADRLSEGADFATAVKEATGRPAVNLGSVTRADLPPELAAAVFSLQQVGQSTPPVQTALGWHVATVTAISPGKEATLEGSHDKLRQDLAQAQAVDVVIDLANQFDEKVAGGASLEQAAQNLGQHPREIAAIDSQGRAPDGKLVEGLPSLNEFLPVLNRTAVGDSSTLTETLDGDYFILRVDSETPAKKKPMDEVRDQVEQMWHDKEQARLAEEKAKALAEKVKGGESLADLAKAEGLELKQTEALTRVENSPQHTPSPLLSQQLFDIKTGEVTTVATGNGQIVAQLKEIQPPDVKESEGKIAQLETQLTSSLKNDVFQQFLNALQQDFDVTINQSLVQQTLSSF